MRYWIPLFTALTLSGPALADPWAEFVDRFSPDYAERQRMLRLCSSYGPKGSQAYAACALQVEQQAARNRAIAATRPLAPAPASPMQPAPTQCAWVGFVWTCN